jgi:hypothetical protein
MPIACAPMWLAGFGIHQKSINRHAVLRAAAKSGIVRTLRRGHNVTIFKSQRRSTATAPMVKLVYTRDLKSLALIGLPVQVRLGAPGDISGFSDKTPQTT